MSSFRTPLFKTLTGYLIILACLSYFGCFDSKKSSTIIAINDSVNYQLIEGVIEKPLASGWAITTEKINGKEQKARIFLTSQEKENLMDEVLFPGSRVALWARPITRRASTLPGLWDWQNYLNREGIDRQYALDRKEDIRVLRKGKGLFAFLYQYHENLLIKIKKRCPDPEVAGLWGGLLLGDKRLLIKSLKESFTQAGVMHLLVVSGLQVSLLAGLLWFLFTHALRLPRSFVQTLSLIGVWGFVVFIGMNPPVVRSAIMISVLMLAPILKREMPALTRLFLTALLFLIAQPYLIQDASFLLSFGSTFGILCGWERLREKEEKSDAKLWLWIQATAWTSLFAWFSLLPIMAHLFHEISLIAPLANMILVPLSGLVTAIGLLYFVFIEPLWSMGIWLNYSVNMVAKFFLAITNFFARLPWSTMATSTWGPCLIAAWFLLIFAWLTSKRSQKKIAATLAACAIAITLTQRLFKNPKVHLLSDGNAFKAIFIEKGYRSRFYMADDSGTSFKNQVALYLKNHGESRTPGPCPRKSNFCQGSGQTFPFEKNTGGPASLNCGSDVLIFPLSTYPIMDNKTNPSVVLTCHDGHFL